MLQLRFGQLTSYLDLQSLRRNFKNGRVRLGQIFLSFSPMVQRIAQEEARYAVSLFNISWTHLLDEDQYN